MALPHAQHMDIINVAPLGDQLRGTVSAGLVNPMAQILRQQDSLGLTGPQADSIASLNRWYTIRNESVLRLIRSHSAAKPSICLHPESRKNAITRSTSRQPSSSDRPRFSNAATVARGSPGDGTLISIGESAGTSTCRSMRSSSGPLRRPW